MIDGAVKYIAKQIESNIKYVYLPCNTFFGMAPQSKIMWASYKEWKYTYMMKSMK